MPHRRLIAVFVAVVALAAPLPAVASEPAARTSGVFLDDDESRYEPFIETAARSGLIRGCNPPANDLFCPHETVTRGQMAIMLARAVPLPPGKGDHFVDDQDTAAEASIEALLAAGATRGCDKQHFCPDRQLTRGELAALLTNTFDLSTGTGVWPFLDLESSPFAGQVATLGRLGHLEPCDPPVGRSMCPGRTVTRSEAAFALASVLALPPKSSTTPAPQPAVDFADGFETLDLWDGRTPGSRNRVRLTDAGYRGAGLRVTMPEGSHYGADFRLDLEKVAGAEPEQLYFRYLLRLDPDWAPKWSGKLPGFSGVYGGSGKGGYPSSPSSPGWSARIQFFGTRADEPRARLGYYVYHLGQERRYGDSMMWNDAGHLQPGEWYCIEGQVRLNTPGLSDGALRAWVDGTPAFDVAGIEFRRPEEPDIRIESFWFNVYYGGKPTAEEDMGLTIDEVAVDTGRVGCGVGSGLDRTVTGDVSGDGFDDDLWWGPCPGGTCFHLRPQAAEGLEPVRRLGDSAWFSLDAHRLGMAAGDFDGDGRDDVVYPGRCWYSETCWRVHRATRAALEPGEDWGGGLRLGAQSNRIVVGDWNGDDLDDLAYRAVCGSDGHPCWRVHRSSGNGFTAPVDGGPHLAKGAHGPVATDINGDGRDDLAYLAPCGKKSCWFTQTSTDAGFGKPRKLGIARAPELELANWFDVTGDGRSDLLTARQGGDGWQVEVRAAARSLAKPKVLARVEGKVKDLALRRQRGEPLEAVLTVACGKGKACVSERLLRRGRLLTVVEYHREVITERLASEEWRIS